ASAGNANDTYNYPSATQPGLSLRTASESLRRRLSPDKQTGCAGCRPSARIEVCPHRCAPPQGRSPQEPSRDEHLNAGPVISDEKNGEKNDYGYRNEGAPARHGSARAKSKAGCGARRKIHVAVVHT